MNGNLKIFNEKGELKFEGNIENGKKNGRAKEYNGKNLIFEGEYLFGEKNGYGKEYNNNNLIFEGIFSYGFRINH